MTSTPATVPRTATDDQNQDFWTVRGQLLILPSDEASIRLIADYTKRDEYCCVATQIAHRTDRRDHQRPGPWRQRRRCGPQPGFAPS